MQNQKKQNPMDGYDKTNRNFQRTDDESDVKGEMELRSETKKKPGGKPVPGKDLPAGKNAKKEHH